MVKPKEIVQDLPQALALHAEPPLMGTDHAFRAEISRQRQNLMDFYAAGIAAFNGDRKAGGQAMHRVMSADSGNPYSLGSSGKKNSVRELWGAKFFFQNCAGLFYERATRLGAVEM